MKSQQGIILDFLFYFTPSMFLTILDMMVTLFIQTV